LKKQKNKKRIDLIYSHNSLVLYNLPINESQIDVCIHYKKCWVISTQSWVKYGQTQMLG